MANTAYQTPGSTTTPDSIPVGILDLVGLRAGYAPLAEIPAAIARSVELAQHAEQWGYTRYWLAEHHSIAGIASAATTILIGHIAGATRTLRVGSGGIMLPNHAPLVVAEQFGTLAALYPNRIDLGLGRAPGGDWATMRALRRDSRQTGDDFPDLLEELRTYLGPSLAGNPVKAIPGQGTEVPITLLGSSTYSAQLAAQLGLPFAFAAHFAPDLLLQATRIYRQSFRPGVLARPHLLVAVPALAAETDLEARRLFTSAQQRFLRLIRSQPVELVPPLAHPDDMNNLWSAAEREAVQSKLAQAILGSEETVRKGLQTLVAATQADEVILVTDTWSQADRLRSYELTAAAARRLQVRKAGIGEQMPEVRDQEAGVGVGGGRESGNRG